MTTTGTAESYATFTRTWWRHGPNGTRVPGPGPKRYHGRRLTEDEARRMCQQWNATHTPGPLSRKMEFERE
jgi:hypothetical protein